MAICTFCSEEIPAGASRCLLCLKEAPVPETPFPPISEARETESALKPATIAQAAEDGVYELPAGPVEIPAEWQRGALYELELPARCPHCRETIRTLRVLRLKRTQVTFTSTLPRSGRVITCPECDRIISAELTAL